MSKRLDQINGWAKLWGLAFFALNVWLTYKLAPLTLDISRLQIKVAAIEQRQSRTEKALDNLSLKSDRILEILVNKGVK